MARSFSLGHFEQLVMTALLSLGENAYGVTIHDKVSSLSAPKGVSLGAVYVTLDRLEEKGLIRSSLSEPRAERGGRAKRCYRLNEEGERALEDALEAARRMSDEVKRAWTRRKWKPAHQR